MSSINDSIDSNPLELTTQIKIIDGEKHLFLDNQTQDPLFLELFDLENNIGYWEEPLPANHWYQIRITQLKRRIISGFTVIDKDNRLIAYEVDGENIIKYQPQSKNIVNRYSPFVVVTGFQGSGTSVFVKSLRYFGAYTGGDSGKFENRKTHESVNMRLFMSHILKQENGNLKELETSFQNVMGIYNYQPNKINIIKTLHLYDDSKFIVEFLPNTKFIAVKKHQDNNTLTPEAHNFSEASQLEILKTQNPQLEGQPIFHLDWNKYFTDYIYAQKVLNYVGLNVKLNENEFNKMLDGIDFDQSKLKS